MRALLEAGAGQQNSARARSSAAQRAPAALQLPLDGMFDWSTCNDPVVSLVGQWVLAERSGGGIVVPGELPAPCSHPGLPS